MKSTHAYLPAPTYHGHIRIAYSSLRATSIHSRAVSSPTMASPGQNYNLGKGYIQGLPHGFSHSYSHFQRCNMALMLCLFPTCSNEFSLFPCPTLEIFPADSPCLCSKPSGYSSSLTTNPDLISSWMDKCITSLR